MLSVIIPMYNEKNIISSTLRTLTEELEKMTNCSSYEVIVSDDGSDDGSHEEIERTVQQLELKRGCVRVVRAEQNAGKGAAVRKGMLAAEGDILLFTDSDLAYGCEVIPQIVEALEGSDCQLVIGSRAIHKDGYAGYTPLRKLASRTFFFLLSKSAGFSHSDSQSGLKAFRKDAAKAIFSRCEVNGFAFDFEVLLLADRLGYKTLEFPVQVVNHRESKVRLFSDSFKMLSDVRKIKKRVRGLFRQGA